MEETQAALRTDLKAHWDIQQIGDLNQASFVAPLPFTITGSFSICFWFQSRDQSGVKVLANLGNKSPIEAGWSVLFSDGQLVFQFCLGEGGISKIFRILPADAGWHHFAGIADRENNRLIAYLDGSNSDWRGDKHRPNIKIKPLILETPVTIGGFTDPAGGHYDHTFGRDGTGMIDDFRLYHRALSPEEAKSFFNPSNLSPIAKISASAISGIAPITIKFDATQSLVPFEQSRYTFWDFGDGHSSQGEKVTHEYAYAGTYPVKLTVIDESHGMDSADLTVTVTGRENPVHLSPVFTNGDGGYACFRIPSIVRANNGDLVAFAEGRLESCSDSTRIIRLVSKRSQDNGQTWGPLQLVARNLVNGKEFAIQNISPVVDRIFGTGKIVLVYNKSEFNEWDIAEGKGVVQVISISSDDDGKSWGPEIDITSQVHRPFNPMYESPGEQTDKWRNQRPTLGHAIQLTGVHENQSTKGRLFFAGSFIPDDAGIFNAYNYVFWSDDLGASWQIGGIIDGPRWDGSSAIGLNEATVVELENGDILINSRNYRDRQPVGVRAVTRGVFDADGNIHFDPTYHDETLVSPTVQASIIRLTRKTEIEFGGKSRILFSNPNHPKARYNLTVRLSYDEGKTWPIHKTVDPGPSAYSDLVVQADMKLGVIYERGNHGGIYYASFPLVWLTDGQVFPSPHLIYIINLRGNTIQNSLVGYKLKENQSDGNPGGAINIQPHNNRSFFPISVFPRV